jgi:arylsulfatase A-like enzyme
MRKPDILLIMTDQQRGDCLGIEDHPVLLTPSMDEIGGSGVRFRRAYSTCPVCIPARRSLLSGQFPSTHGVVGYEDGQEWDPARSLPTVLRNAGYHTYLAGRDMHQYPVRKRYGYDHMVVLNDYRRWLERKVDVDTYSPEGGMMGDYYATGVMNNDWTARPWHLDESLHHTNWTVNEAMRFLQTRDTTCPYFLTVSFLAPHPPLVPPACYMDRYLHEELPAPAIGDWASPPEHDGKGCDPESYRVNLHGLALKNARAGYYGMINHIDDQIRRLLNPINGVDRENTIIIFTSDHGEMLGDHYRFRKTAPYEGSARIPFLISAPQQFGLKQRLVVEEPVCLEDIMPTVLDMIGEAPVPGVDGKSVLPLMRGEPTSWREYLHLEHSELEEADDIGHHTLTDGQEKFIWFTRTGREQFFDLRIDPHELRDLIAAPESKERVKHWRQRLIAELKDRPEGFTDGSKLLPNRPYPPVMKDKPEQES